MSVPAWEELDRLIDVLRDMEPRGGLAAAECQDLEAVAVLLEGYPLPVAEEEREELARLLERLVRLAGRPSNRHNVIFLDEDEDRENLLRAAALLRTPAGARILDGTLKVSSEPIADGQRFVNIWGPSFGFSLQVVPEVEAALREMVNAHNRLATAPAGVDREAVLRLIAGARHTTCLPGLTAQRADAAFANLLAAIRALPEAKS